MLDDLGVIVAHALVPFLESCEMLADLAVIVLKGSEVLHGPLAVATKRRDVVCGGVCLLAVRFDGPGDFGKGVVVLHEQFHGASQDFGEWVDARAAEGGEDGLDRSRSETRRRRYLVQVRGQFFESASKVLLGGDRILPVKLPRSGEVIISS